MSIFARSGARAASLTYAAQPRVNLLPPLERRRREQSALIRRWTAAAAVAVVVAVVGVVAAGVLERSARDDLKSEQARTIALAGQAAKFKDVSATSRDKSSYEAYRTQVMSQDVTWASVFKALQSALPPGAAITAFDATVGGGAPGSTAGAASAGAAGVAGSAAIAPAPSGTAVSLTVTVSSKQSVDQSAMVASLAKVPGVLGVDLSSLTSAAGSGYSATTAVFLDGSVLSHKYAKAAQ